MTILVRPATVKPVRSTWRRLPGQAVARVKAKTTKPALFTPQVFVEIGADGKPELVRFKVPIRTRSLNEKLRGGRAAHRWAKQERDATRLLFPGQATLIEGPFAIELRRVSPSAKGLDRGDNLPGALKAVRDEVALVLGFKDDSDLKLHFIYEQERGPFAVLITITSWGRLQRKGGFL
jgi:hypothetical protein